MTPPATSQRTLSTADERRETILEAAERVFAARGLHGTPTMEIAKAAGISQAYLFRLFPTKTELFTALTQRVNDRVHETMAQAAADAKAAGEDVLIAMGKAYVGLLADRNLLLVQLHSHAAGDDPVDPRADASLLRAARRARRARDGRRPRRGARVLRPGDAAERPRRDGRRGGRRALGAGPARPAEDRLLLTPLFFSHFHE